MTGARLRSMRSTWPCAGQAVPHSSRNRAVTMTGEDARPLILSCEHLASGARQATGSLPVRAGTLGPAREASRAVPSGVALQLTEQESLMMKRILQRHLQAIQQSISFWKHQYRNSGFKPSFDLGDREKESALVQRLYLDLHQYTKAKRQ